MTVAQERAIDLLMEGKLDREVAEAVDVTRPTVTDWRNHRIVEKGNSDWNLHRFLTDKGVRL
ncbi:MAG: helix-turn-helix domain-containing protein [Planctomycetes bacterium]|nr:helix-turn-helix domain-containing protein [Planctomycetota bacterium]